MHPAAHLDLHQVPSRCLGHTQNGDDTRRFELDDIGDIDALDISGTGYRGVREAFSKGGVACRFTPIFARRQA